MLGITIHVGWMWCAQWQTSCRLFLVHQLTHPCRVPLSELMSHEEAICESFLPGDCTEHPCDAPPGQRFWMSALVLIRLICKVTDPPYGWDRLPVRYSCDSGMWMTHGVSSSLRLVLRVYLFGQPGLYFIEMKWHLLCPSSLLSTHRVSPGHSLLALTPALQTSWVSSFSEPQLTSSKPSKGTANRDVPWGQEPLGWASFVNQLSQSLWGRVFLSGRWATCLLEPEQLWPSHQSLRMWFIQIQGWPQAHTLKHAHTQIFLGWGIQMCLRDWGQASYMSLTSDGRGESYASKECSC